MIKFKFDLSSLRKTLLARSEPEYVQNLIAIASLAVAELVAETPVDTGRAAAGWTYRLEGDTVVIENDVAYVKFLNAGTSEQAPSFYIESVLLKYGKPSGPIVTYT